MKTTLQQNLVMRTKLIMWMPSLVIESNLYNLVENGAKMKYISDSRRNSHEKAILSGLALVCIVSFKSGYDPGFVPRCNRKSSVRCAMESESDIVVKCDDNFHSDCVPTSVSCDVSGISLPTPYLSSQQRSKRSRSNPYECCSRLTFRVWKRYIAIMVMYGLI